MNSLVRLYSYCGTYVNLAHIARVSFGKNPIVDADLYSQLILRDSFENDTEKEDVDKLIKDYNRKALNTVKTCFQLRHMSIFEFANMTFFIHCPIYVARQLMRYRQASYIERSLRRCQPFSVDEDKDYTDSLNRYYEKLSQGERKEVARAVLTLSTPTEFLMSVNLRELFHIFDERLDKTAQLETRETVKQMFDLFEEKHPELATIYRDSKVQINS